MSITEVAKIAGVSVATVSRVINGHASVQPQLARKVREAMHDAGYTPRLTRPGPKPKIVRTKNLTGSVGIVLLGRTEALLQFPYMSRLMAGIADAAHSAESQLMILPMPDKSQPPRAVRERLVDGLILTGLENTANTGEFDLFHPLPCVWVGGSRPEKQEIDHVLADNNAIGCIAADYLLECGCRTTALIDHTPNHAGFGIRRRNFSRQLKKHGASVEEFISRTEHTNESESWDGNVVRRELSRLLDRMLKNGPLPDGVFLQADQQAAVFHSLLRERGIKPEKDVTLISCNNDAPWRATMHPCPATIDPLPYEQGIECFNRLNQQIKFGASAPCSITISPKLVK
jgi:LacI family transcriptional regulator